MTRLISTIIFILVFNLIFNALVGINPLFRYLIYAAAMIYFFRSMRFVAPKSRPGSYTYQEPVNPTPRNNGDVIDVEYTEHEEKSGN